MTRLNFRSAARRKDADDPLSTATKQELNSALRISCLEDSIHMTGLAPPPEKTDMKKSVIFGVIQIRHYERIAGDNPCVRRGVPLGIGWLFDQENDISVDDYEKNRRPRRCKSDLLMSAADRYELLVCDWQRSPRELACAVRTARRTKDHRRTTIVVTEFEDRMNLHRFKETFSRLLRRRRTSTAQDDDSSERQVDHMNRISRRLGSLRASASSQSSDLDVTRHRGHVSLQLRPMEDDINESKEENNGLTFRSSVDDETTSATSSEYHLNEVLLTS